MKKFSRNPEYEGDDTSPEIKSGTVINIVEFYEEISHLEDIEPQDKRSKEYKAWRTLINKKMEAFNKHNKTNIYKLIK